MTLRSSPQLVETTKQEKHETNENRRNKRKNYKFPLVSSILVCFVFLLLHGKMFEGFNEVGKFERFLDKCVTLLLNQSGIIAVVLT
jgi:hypothetical protein